MQNTVYFSKQKSISLWKDKTPLLTRLDIELTERCNNNCIHCDINLPKDDFAAKERELSTQDLKEILKEAVSLGCLSVRFTGGEPLLRDDFEEIYIFARKSGLKVLLFTNATLITSHLAELFSRIPPLEDIEISLYGMKRESYEPVTRTPGSFALAWQGINFLLAKKIPFVVKAALLPPNKSEIEEFQNWSKTIPTMDRPPAYSMFFYLSARQDKDKDNRIKKLRIRPEEGLKILSRNKNYLKEMQEFSCRFMGPCADKLFSCGAGRGGGWIDAYGKLQACWLLRHPDLVYDLKKGTLRDALTNFFPKIREMKATNADYLSRCSHCFLKGLCEQCPGWSWREYGTLDTPVEYLCDIAHTQARYLGLIEENEKAWEEVKKFTLDIRRESSILKNRQGRADAEKVLG